MKKLDKLLFDSNESSEETQVNQNQTNKFKPSSGPPSKSKKQLNLSGSESETESQSFEFSKRKPANQYQKDKSKKTNESIYKSKKQQIQNATGSYTSSKHNHRNLDNGSDSSSVSQYDDGFDYVPPNWNVLPIPSIGKSRDKLVVESINQQYNLSNIVHYLKHET